MHIETDGFIFFDTGGELSSDGSQPSIRIGGSGTSRWNRSGIKLHGAMSIVYTGSGMLHIDGVMADSISRGGSGRTRTKLLRSSQGSGGTNLTWHHRAFAVVM